MAASQPSPPLRANVYIDGFNLFRGLLKGQGNSRWLDLRALAQRMYPHYSIGFVRYFTARVYSRHMTRGSRSGRTRISECCAHSRS